MIKRSWGPFFKTLSSGLCQAVVFDGDEFHYIPLLFEKEKIDTIKYRMTKIPFKEEIPFSYFKLIVSGCIRYCIRY